MGSRIIHKLLRCVATIAVGLTLLVASPSPAGALAQTVGGMYVRCSNETIDLPQILADNGEQVWAIAKIWWWNPSAQVWETYWSDWYSTTGAGSYSFVLSWHDYNTGANAQTALLIPYPGYYMGAQWWIYSGSTGTYTTSELWSNVDDLSGNLYCLVR